MLISGIDCLIPYENIEFFEIQREPILTDLQLEKLEKYGKVIVTGNEPKGFAVFALLKSGANLRISLIYETKKEAEGALKKFYRFLG